jgi:hypothetical protein
MENTTVPTARRHCWRRRDPGASAAMGRQQPPPSLWETHPASPTPTDPPSPHHHDQHHQQRSLHQFLLHQRLREKEKWLREWEKQQSEDASWSCKGMAIVILTWPFCLFPANRLCRRCCRLGRTSRYFFKSKSYRSHNLLQGCRPHPAFKPYSTTKSINKPSGLELSM